MDGGGSAALTPEDADHEITFSPSGRWFVDVHARPNVAPVSVLRATRQTCSSR